MSGSTGREWCEGLARGAGYARREWCEGLARGAGCIRCEWCVKLDPWRDPQSGSTRCEYTHVDLLMYILLDTCTCR